MMNEPLALESLEQRLLLIRKYKNEIEEEEALIAKLIQLRRSQRNGFTEVSNNERIRSSKAQSLIDAVVSFLQVNGGEVRSGEIQAYLEEQGYLEKDAASNQSKLSHLLKDEAEKPDGKIKKVGHGVYTLRK